MIKCLPAVRETRVPSLGWEDTLEKEMATHSSILAWKIPWTEESGRLHPWVTKSQTQPSMHIYKRTLNLLTWGAWFSLINSNLLMF